MLYENERVEIIRVCRLMQELGYFLGTWGNISIRIGNHILLTPSRIDYDSMVPGDMVVIDMAGNVIEGERNPTSEKEVHRQIYLIRGDVKAIIHAHTAKAMAISAMDIQEVPCVVEEMSQLLGGAIPLTIHYVPAKDHEKLGLAAAEKIGDRNGVILRNHGPVSCGRTLAEAILVTRVIEKASAIYLDIRAEERIKQIPKNHVTSERYRFLYTYGREKT